jgi:hypothetical protein
MIGAYSYWTGRHGEDAAQKAEAVQRDHYGGAAEPSRAACIRQLRSRRDLAQSAYPEQVKAIADR